jgi:hypothetical protein
MADPADPAGVVEVAGPGEPMGCSVDITAHHHIR